MVRYLFAALLTGILTGIVSARPLIFSATGCGPYQPAEEPLLEKYVQLVNADGKSDFLVHLGDVVSGSKKEWPESQYEKVAGILKKSRVPVFIVPGDNEWNDLNNPERGWKFWTRHFLDLDKHFPGQRQVERQPVRPENWAWNRKDVLLIGINLVGGRVHDKKEWATRHEQNNDWIRAQFQHHRKNVRAAVIFAQALPNATHAGFTAKFGPLAREFGKPVLFLHADGHVWQVEKNWVAPNVLRVMTDQLGRAPPVLVTVTDDPQQPFVFDRRLDWK